MKVRHTLVLLFLCLALGAYVYFFEIKKVTTSDDTSITVVTELDPDQIDKCSFAFDDGRLYEFERKTVTRFELRQPITARADFDQISRILASLSKIEAHRSLEPEQQHDPLLFGFEQPRATVTLWLHDQEKPVTLRFGAANPIKYSIYLRKDDDATIYAVGEYLFNSFNIDLNHFREQILLPKPEADITGLTITLGPETSEFRQIDNAWRLISPGPYRVSQTHMSELISSVSEIRISSFLDKADPVAERALAQPVALVSVELKNRETPEIMLIGQTTSDQLNRYARLASDPLPVLINADYLAALMVDPKTMIDPKPLTRYKSEYSKLSITTKDAACSFERVEETWRPSDSKPALDLTELGHKIEAFLTVLTELTLDGFRFDGAGGLPLDQPVMLRLTLSPGADLSETVTIGQNSSDKSYRLWTDNDLPPADISAETAQTLLEQAQSIMNIVK
ncbi:DUF4340 domain-containing protein [bacterium]|nr:DUF4340 domain-containing protein [bacterium]